MQDCEWQTYQGVFANATVNVSAGSLASQPTLEVGWLVRLVKILDLWNETWNETWLILKLTLLIIHPFCIYSYIGVWYSH